MIMLGMEVPAVPVNITIQTGYTAQHFLNLRDFPSCIKYTFELDFLPLQSAEAEKFCGDYVPLPFALNTTQALGLKEIHLSDRFLVPQNGASYASLLSCSHY